MLDPRIAGAVYLLIFLIALFAIAGVVVALLRRRVRQQNDFEHSGESVPVAQHSVDDWDVGGDMWDGEPVSQPEFMDGSTEPERLALDPHIFPHLTQPKAGTPTRPQVQHSEEEAPADNDADTGEEQPISPPQRPNRKSDNS